MSNSKKWYLSRTVWLALLQAVSGLLTGVILFLEEGASPEALAALSVGLKGLIDLRVRFTTEEAITL